MNRPATLVSRPAQEAGPVFVVQRTGEGFTVYAPENPATCYQVMGTSEHASCTCPEYIWHASDHPETPWHQRDPHYRCPHISYVFGTPATKPEADKPAKVETLPARSAFTTNCDPPEEEPLHLVLKRSVSPDGRINSLSIELACPLGDNDFNDVRPKVEAYLLLQSDVADVFREMYAAPATSGQAAPGQVPAQVQPDKGNGSVPVQLLDVAGMRTRFGWRTFLNVQSNGQTLKLFGNKKELGDWITNAGYPHLAQNLDTGVQLNVPCRAIVKPSPDGKYLNVEQLLPNNGGGQPGRRW